MGCISYWLINVGKYATLCGNDSGLWSQMIQLIGLLATQLKNSAQYTNTVNELHALKMFCFLLCLSIFIGETEILKYIGIRSLQYWVFCAVHVIAIRSNHLYHFRWVIFSIYLKGIHKENYAVMWNRNTNFSTENELC